MQLLVKLILVISVGMVALLPEARAAEPARLLTMETAHLLSSDAVLGLQQAGFQFKSLLVETNPLIDFALTANIGAKYVWQTNGPFSYTIGARYLKFLGSKVLESRLKQSEPKIERLELAYQGATAFAGASWENHLLGVHANLQWADISGSRVRGVILGVDVPIGSLWSVPLEGGYDFANTQARASVGVLRSGETFGVRLGLTYVHIDDAALKYSGVVPVIDLFWLLGAKSGSSNGGAGALEPANQSPPPAGS